MQPLDWHPEKFSATGNISSEGIKRQLGRYDLDPLAVLIRETVQNSWDARIPGHIPHFHLRGWTIQEEPKELLRSTVLPSRPQGLSLDALDRPGGIFALGFADRHTRGLSGPIRADHVLPETEERAFVDFLLDVGQQRNAAFGGGTYGYGKSILYRLSQLATILVHTHSFYEGKPVSRFMAAALGEQYGVHTGRHWWGRESQDGAPQPLTGEEADRLANRLGFPEFEEGETGTTIVLLAPDLGIQENDEEETQARTPEEGMAFAGASILWNFWPKMVSSCPHESRMTFSMELEGEHLPIPRAEDHHLFRKLVHAMSDVETARNDNQYRIAQANHRVLEIASSRPKRELGFLALRRYSQGRQMPSLPSTPTDHRERMEKEIRALCPASTRFHHVALMRDARLIVRYEQGPPAEEAEYAGVFLVHRDPEIDQAFAVSEPPTHDDWQPQGMERPRGTFVRVALRHIKENIQNFANPVLPRNDETGTPVPLGQISERLAGLVSSVPAGSPRIAPEDSAGTEPATPGNETSTRSGRQPGKQRSSRPAIRSLDESGELGIENGQAVMRLRFQVSAGEEGATVRIHANPAALVLDGSAVEQEPPQGAERPRVLRWEIDDGRWLGEGSYLDLVPDPERAYAVLVTVPDDTAVSLNLAAEGAGK